MRVTCEKCDRAYDDAQRWTICPHNRLEASPEGDGRGEHGGGYCELHDLFNCPFHGDRKPPSWRQQLADRLDSLCAIDRSATGINRKPVSWWKVF